jgi:hypothetical protein
MRTRVALFCSSVIPINPSCGDRYTLDTPEPKKIHETTSNEILAYTFETYCVHAPASDCKNESRN